MLNWELRRQAGRDKILILATGEAQSINGKGEHVGANPQ